MLEARVGRPTVSSECCFGMVMAMFCPLVKHAMTIFALFPGTISFMAAPRNSARRHSRRFCARSKFPNRRNPVCTRKGYAASVSQLALATVAQYFPVWKLPSWRKRFAVTRRRNCAVLPYVSVAGRGAQTVRLNKRTGCKSPRCRHCKCRDGLPLVKASHWSIPRRQTGQSLETQVRRPTETFGISE